MRNISKSAICIILFAMYAHVAYAQDSIQTIKISSKYIEKTSARISEIECNLSRKTEKALKKIRREELKLKQKLYKVDSLLAKKLFSTALDARYEEFISKVSSKAEKITKRRVGNYIPFMDTIKNSLQFLENNELVKNSKLKLGKTLESLDQLEGRFDQAASVQQFLRERRQYLKEQLERVGMSSYLKKMNKEVYYYSQLVKDYKHILSDPKKIEKKAIEIITNTKAFKEFMSKNSAIASLFNMPGGSSMPSSTSLTGVQTRIAVQQIIQNTVITNTANPQQFIQQQLQVGSAHLENLKSKLAFVDLSGNAEQDPGFKPNSQRTKSLFKRLEYNVNFQFGKTNRFLPTMGEMAVSVGYKLNDKSVIGIGSSYKLGLGKGIDNLKFTSQGFGVRSYIDWKVKGGFYLSGGYEKNYLPQLSNIPDVTNIPLWQQSSLIGLTKKYSIGKKRKSYVQLLFDFLSYRNIPRSQPIIFRNGVTF